MSGGAHVKSVGPRANTFPRGIFIHKRHAYAEAKHSTASQHTDSLKFDLYAWKVPYSTRHEWLACYGRRRICDKGTT